MNFIDCGTISACNYFIGCNDECMKRKYFFLSCVVPSMDAEGSQLEPEARFDIIPFDV